jgi:putative tryptophan/tyrosine transport system substrate-binding protein
MRRRQFIRLLAVTAVAWPLLVHAQRRAMPVIGLLGAAEPDDDEVARNLTAFRRGLAETGYVEGQNVSIEYRWAEGHYERLPALAAELVARDVDVIVNEGGAPSVLAAKNATSQIPIVFHTGNDPVAEGLVASLARPGGNLTGVSVLQVEISPKLLQFTSELVAKARVIAVLVNPNNANAEPTLRQLQEAADREGMQIRALKAGTESEIDAALARFDQLPADALIVGGDTFFTTQRERIITLVAAHRIPAVYSQPWFARAGGMFAYGPSLQPVYRLKGNYAGKILSGAKPADLPVQQPATIELVINLKTANALGITIPSSLLARADEVIE